MCIRDSLGRALRPLVLGRHPRLGGLLNELLADRVHAGVEGSNGPGSLRAACSLVGELGEQPIEGLHAAQSTQVKRRVRPCLLYTSRCV